jgi:hypothetical protein
MNVSSKRKTQEMLLVYRKFVSTEFIMVIMEYNTLLVLMELIFDIPLEFAVY